MVKPSFVETVGVIALNKLCEYEIKLQKCPSCVGNLLSFND